MEMILPDIIPISCVDCLQAMHVEHRHEESCTDLVIVAAECRCGRVIGILEHGTLMRFLYGNSPIVRQDIKMPDFDIGKGAVALIEQARERILSAERLIAAATWVKDGIWAKDRK
jgi:hypothetical protein